VVIAAHNEAARIEQTVRRLCRQRGVSLEIVVVDDRSTDGTRAIVTRLSAEDARVRLVPVAALPDGWLGKCHACYVGAAQARGQWLLFTDADCWLEADVVARALEVAAAEHAGHVTLTPGVEPTTLPGGAWHLAFLVTVADWIARTNHDVPGAYFGMGAFNLIERTLYERSGGYEALRLTVLDDLRLGLLVRRAGGRTRAFIGGSDVVCHWGTSARAMIRLMEKNYFAALDYRTGVAAAIALVAALVVVVAIAAPFVNAWLGLVLPLTWWTLAMPAYVCARRLRWSAGPALLMPAVFPLLIYAVLRSAVVTLRQGGVRWRDDFYPLAALRARGVK
jgi:glycosyltransferase involved in cell wall biosynthesis